MPEPGDLRMRCTALTSVASTMVGSSPPLQSRTPPVRECRAHPGALARAVAEGVSVAEGQAQLGHADHEEQDDGHDHGELDEALAAVARADSQRRLDAEDVALLEGPATVVRTRAWRAAGHEQVEGTVERRHPVMAVADRDADVVDRRARRRQRGQPLSTVQRCDSG